MAQEEQAVSIAQLLDQTVLAVEKRWVGLVIESAGFYGFLQERFGDDARSLPGLEALFLEDLALCYGCELGDSGALVHFSEFVHTQVQGATRRFEQRGDLVAELHQHLLTLLLVGDGDKPPKLPSYGGRGPLGRWIHVVASRQALAWIRKDKREDGLLQDNPQPAFQDIELEFLKRQYQKEFSIAFSKAMAQLTSKERNLLYYHAVRGLSIDQLGAFYRVHRATAFRWIRDARGQLVENTRALLARELQIDENEIDRAISLLKSNLDLSVERLLQPSVSLRLPKK